MQVKEDGVGTGDIGGLKAGAGAGVRLRGAQNREDTNGRMEGQGIGAEEIGLLRGGAGVGLMRGTGGHSVVTRCRC